MVAVTENNTSIEEVAKLNLESQKELVLAITQKIIDNKYDDTEIRGILSEQGIQLNRIEELAEILNDFEKGQIEEMLLAMLNNANLQDILAGISVTVGGINYSVKSVVEAIANVPQVVKEEPVEDADGNTVGRKMTLSDGTVVNMNATKTVSADGKTITYEFTGEAKGFPIKMSSILQKKSIVAGDIEVSTWMPIAVEHISFDVTQLLKAPVTVVSNEEIADINQDGVVGN